MKCPYCRAHNKTKNIIDTGHSKLENMSRKGNTKNIYLCPECGEVFEAFQKTAELMKPVDIYFNRKYQYCAGNIESTDYLTDEADRETRWKKIY